MEPICKNPVFWHNFFCSRSFGKLFNNVIFLLVIWAPHSRPAVQTSDLVKDPKILLETFIKIQTVERNLTVWCVHVQFSSSSQSGFLPCYHLKMKGMHLYFFCPRRSRSIPTRIRVQAPGLSYYVETGKKRPKLPSDRLCSFSPHAEKKRCADWCIAVAVRSEEESVLAAARWFTKSLACLTARSCSPWSCRGFNVFTFWCCYPQVLWVLCCGNFQDTVRFGFLR